MKNTDIDKLTLGKPFKVDHPDYLYASYNKDDTGLYYMIYMDPDVHPAGDEYLVDHKYILNLNPSLVYAENRGSNISIDLNDLGLADADSSTSLYVDEFEILDHSVGTDQELGKALAYFGKADHKKQKDLLYIRFKLVHANTNRNKDRFLKEELQAAEQTPVLKLINWRHKEPSIGVIYASKYVESDNENESDYIECLGAISKLKYKSYAEEIIKRYNENKLFFSMEVWFKEAECSECNEVFGGKEDEYCSHLKNRFASDSKTSRVLRHITFAGSGVVEDPADIEAEALALAEKQTKEDGLVEIKTYTQDELDAAIAAAIEGSNSEKEHEELVAKAESQATEIDALNQKVTELVAKADSLSLEIESLNKKNEDISKEYNSFKMDIETRDLAIARITDLASAGFDVPDKDSNADEYNQLFDYLRSVDDKSFDVMKTMAKKISSSKAADTSASDDDTDDTSGNDIIITASTHSRNTEAITSQDAIRLAFGKKN